MDPGSWRRWLTQKPPRMEQPFSLVAPTLASHIGVLGSVPGTGDVMTQVVGFATQIRGLDCSLSRRLWPQLSPSCGGHLEQ